MNRPDQVECYKLLDWRQQSRGRPRLSEGSLARRDLLKMPAQTMPWFGARDQTNGIFRVVGRSRPVYTSVC